MVFGNGEHYRSWGYCHFKGDKVLFGLAAYDTQKVKLLYFFFFNKRMGLE